MGQEDTCPVHELFPSTHKGEFRRFSVLNKRINNHLILTGVNVLTLTCYTFRIICQLDRVNNFAGCLRHIFADKLGIFH